MAVRIRVFPQNGGFGGYGGMYGMNSPYAQLMTQNKLNQQKLSNEKRTSALRLNYERALFNERLKLTELQAQVRYGGLGGINYGSPLALGGLTNSWMGLGALGMNPLSSGSNFFGGLGLGGLF